MKRYTGPRDIRFWIAIAVLLAASASFAIIADSVTDNSPILKQDMQVSVWLHTHNNPVFTAFLYAITQVHSPVGMTIIAVLFGLWLYKSGHHYWALSLALAVPGGMLMNTVVKLLVNRARPVWEDPILTISSASFPSGHAAGATLFYGFVAAFVVWNTRGPWRHVIAVACCTVMVAVVGFSRIYLGVHYLSDVLAAVSMSMVWLVLCLIAVRGLAHRRGAS